MPDPARPPQPTRRRQLRRLGNHGTTAVEFAFIAPALLLMLFGAMEFGRMIWTVGALNFAVQEAARCASVTPGICSSASATANYAANEIAGAYTPASTFNVSTPGNVSNPGCGHLVTASFPFAFLSTNVFGPANNASVTLTAMACEN